MSTRVHDVGWLKRVDREDGTSALVDGFGQTVATMDTKLIQGFSENLGLYRFRYMEIGTP